MNKIGFTKSKSDAAVFYRHNRKGFVIIAVAVDDLMITEINDNIIPRDQGRYDENLQYERSKRATLVSESQD